MALVTLHYVICDVCGKPGNQPVEGKYSARHHAAASGFTSAESDLGRGRRRRDYCPDHKPGDPS